MAIVTSNEYDHIDVVNGSNTNRHYIKDTTARNSIEDLKSALVRLNCFDILREFCSYNDATSGNVTYRWNQDKSVCTVNGTASSTNVCTLYNNTSVLPNQIVPGETYYVNVASTNNRLQFRLFVYRSGSSGSDVFNFYENGMFTVPDDAVGIIIRIQLRDGETATNDTISVAITNSKTNVELSKEYPIQIKTLVQSASIDQITDYSIWFIGSGLAPVGYPFNAGWLLTIPTTVGATTNTCQVAIEWTSANQVHDHVLMRIKNNTTWRDWERLVYTEPFEKAISNIFRYNCFELAGYSNGTSGTANGITYTKNADNSWTITGATETKQSFRNVLNYYNTQLPEFIVPGRSYKVTIPDSSVATLKLYIYLSDGTNTSMTLPKTHTFSLPENTTGIILRFEVAPNTTINETVPISILAVPVLGGEGGDTIIVNQTVHNDNFENQYTISVNPQITTDTNGWLQPVDTETSSEDGKTDMTSAIMAMLTQNGYCHLAPGIFYVSGNIDMPEDSMLEGCGRKTVIRLMANVTEGYAIKMEKRNTVSNLRVSGSYSTIPSASFDGNKGTRHGIIFNSRYEEGTRKTDHSVIKNIFIDNFTGCGIKCYNTSMTTSHGIYASQIKAECCQTGIFVDYHSEFNKFELVNTRFCYIGCENDGGNNMFIGCTFGATNTGFLIDNSLSDKANNSHGGVIGCTFCHIGDNQGIAIAVKNIANGYTFSDCQVWYCSILIENSYGVAFTGMEFGRGTTGNGATINISGGGTVIFTGCLFMNDIENPPDITITNNNKVHFTGCYGSHSGNAISA